MNFFLQDKTFLDNEDLLDNWNYCQIALFPHGRNGIDRPIDCNPFYFYFLMHQSLIDYLIMSGRMNMHSHVAFYFPTFYRNVLNVQWEDDFLA